MQPQTAADIGNQVEKLYAACIMWLGHSHDLWQRAERMTTPEGRETARSAREQLLMEVEQSIGQMAKTIDGVQTLRLHPGGDSDLARLRRELDASLSVARRVEERLEAEFGEFGAKTQAARDP